MTENTFDDRLPGHDTVDGLLDAAKRVVRELAADHAYGDVCGVCVNGTPLSKESARDVPKAGKVEELAAETQGRVADLSGEDDPYWVESELTREYAANFRDECADPANCGICTKTIIEDDEPCGHQEMGEPCPAQ